MTRETLPTEEIITTTELACQSLTSNVAASLQSNVVQILTKAKQPKSNITTEEQRALLNLRGDRFNEDTAS